jgi:dipeptidase D
MIISHLEPTNVWTYFEQICKIPRLSKNESKIREFLINFGNKNGLEVKKDSVGNVLLKKPADPGFEKFKPVLLQSHMDMVGEKDSDNPHDWNSDPITPIIDEGWIRAERTTLGADDGIGIAAQMAVLTDPEIKSGPVECLFTVDEESGMTGAIYLEPGFFNSNILINLDSEDEGELFIGCAGGIDTVATWTFNRDIIIGDNIAYEISLTGLLGGHSGDEIHKGFGNSVKIMNRLLLGLNNKLGIRVNKFEGGNLRNAIPREAFATIVAKESNKEAFLAYLFEFKDNIRAEFENIEPEFSFNHKEIAIPDYVIDQHTQDNLLNAIDKCPHGVIDWSPDMNGLVETSTNLASVKYSGDNTIEIVTSQRSSVEASKIKISEQIEMIFSDANARVIHSDGYPGWQPDPSSEILAITESSYKELFNEKPLVRAIHAGLECGLFLKKYPTLDMISFGPTIKGAHTPQERINIDTTRKFWDLLLRVLQKIPTN